jgi:dihydropyrimidinase/allantoinase
MVPVIVSEGYNKGRISLSKLVDILSTNAAKHYGLYPKKGALNIGSDADFTILDLEKEWTIDPKTMVSMCGYTPLEGMKLKGKVYKTVVRGNLVYQDEEEGILNKLKNYDVVFNNPEELTSAEYQVSYRKQHPEVIVDHIKNIKGIMVKPGFGKFTKRVQIMKLDKKITY